MQLTTARLARSPWPGGLMQVIDQQSGRVPAYHKSCSDKGLNG